MLNFLLQLQAHRHAVRGQWRLVRRDAAPSPWRHECQRRDYYVNYTTALAGSVCDMLCNHSAIRRLFASRYEVGCACNSHAAEDIGSLQRWRDSHRGWLPVPDGDWGEATEEQGTSHHRQRGSDQQTAHLKSWRLSAWLQAAWRRSVR